MFLKEYNTVDICLENYICLEEGFDISNFLNDYIEKLDKVKIDKAYINKQKVKYNKLLSDFKSKLSKEEKIILDKKTKEIEDNFKSVNRDGILVESSEYMFLEESFIKDKIEKLKDVITKSFLTFDDNVLKGVSIVLLVLIMQGIIVGALSFIFGPIVSLNINNILIAPILEELGRYIALKTGSIDSFTSSGNIMELITYSLSFLTQSSNIFIILYNIILRIVAASELHTANADRMKKSIIDNSENKSLITSIIYHVVWNSINILFNKIGGVINLIAVPTTAIIGRTIFKQ